MDGWRRYWCDEAWGDVRADMRMEAYAQRHTHGVENVSGLWPHWPPKEDPQAVLEKLRKAKTERKAAIYGD